MAYITPESTPVDTLCWRIFIPNEQRAVAAFLGQLLELAYARNWEQTDGISVLDTVALFDDVYQSIEYECRNMIGSLVHYATINPPPSILACDGSQYLRVDYPDLYDALLPAYIIDADNFITPAIEDKFIMSAGITHTVEETGGSDTHTLLESEMPAHSHTYDFPTTSIQFNASGAPNVDLLAIPPVVLPTSTVGGGNAHNNLPPYVAYKVGIVAK